MIGIIQVVKTQTILVGRPLGVRNQFMTHVRQAGAFLTVATQVYGLRLRARHQNTKEIMIAMIWA